MAKFSRIIQKNELNTIDEKANNFHVPALNLNISRTAQTGKYNTETFYF